MRIKARIGPPHPPVCRKRRLNEAVRPMKPAKLRSRIASGVARYLKMPSARADLEGGSGGSGPPLEFVEFQKSNVN